MELYILAGIASLETEAEIAEVETRFEAIK